MISRSAINIQISKEKSDDPDFRSLPIIEYKLNWKSYMSTMIKWLGRCDRVKYKAWVIAYPSAPNDDKKHWRQSNDDRWSFGIYTKKPFDLKEIEPSVYTIQ